MIKSLFKKMLMNLSSLFSTNESKIIFYHDIHFNKIYCLESSTSLNLFSNHVDLINESDYELVSEITNQKLQIKIQFDDGFKGVYDCLQFIIENKIPIEIFLIVNNINKENYLSEQEIIEMNKYPFITFSSHTVNHLQLNILDDKQLFYELESSKNSLEKITNCEVDSVCYPKGLFNDKVVRLAKKTGYSKQYCSIPGSFKNNVYPDVYNRNLAQFCSPNEFKLLLNGGLSIFKYWFKLKHFKK